MDRGIERAKDCKFEFNACYGRAHQIAVPLLRGRTTRLAEMFEDQASPIYPLRITPGPEHKYRWLRDNELYQSWRDSPQLSIMHVFGSEDVSDAAEYAFQDSEGCRDMDNPENIQCIHYFKFVRHDVRRNSIRAMVETFLSQIYGQWRIPPLRDWLGFQEPPDFDACWSDMDALCFINKVRIQLGSSVGCTWILDGLDQCDDSRDTFLTEISNIVSSSEQSFKVFITSVGDPSIFPTISGLSIDVRSNTAPNNANTSVVDYTSMIRLSNAQPELYLSMEPKIRELLSSCKDDEELRLLLVDCLNKTQTWMIVQGIECSLSSLPGKGHSPYPAINTEGKTSLGAKGDSFGVTFVPATRSRGA